MNFLPQLSAWQFALAGAICAAGPIIIHLLNRRRYKVVEWAAMDFLREAMARNRRIMRLRDLLLLLLRTAAVLLFGLALARPFLAASDEQFDGSKPLHAVLVFDNSLSMGFESLGGTLLDQAKQRATEFLDRLPAGSRVSVIPLCGAAGGYSPDAYTIDDAREAITRIAVVDRAASVSRAMNEARRAAQAGPELAQRIVFLTDQQQQNWRDVASGETFADLESVQIVDVSGSELENTWIADLRVQDGLADVETPTTLVAVLRHEGAGPRHDLPVTLSVDGIEVASKTVTLEPGAGAREVAFTHTFSGYQPEVGRPALAAVQVTIAPDRLPTDDQRHLVVPVVASLPVVFVDQFGASEDVLKGRVGETRHLRKLLAPTSGNRNDSSLTSLNADRELVQVRHVTPTELSREVLADARLVVLAGVAPPTIEQAQLLREYVEQGGQLVIAAGAEFDPAEWNASPAAPLADEEPSPALLPAPLEPNFVGTLPNEASGTLRPMFLDFESLSANKYFQLAGVDEQELRDLYSEPLFFQAVASRLDDETVAELREAERERLRRIAEFLRESAERRTEFARQESAGGVDAAAQQQQRDDQQRLESLEPDWLAWQSAEPSEAERLRAAMRETDEGGETDDAVRDEQVERQIESLVEQAMPRVLARLTDEAGTPLLIERQIGRGDVLFMASGLYSPWNTLPRTNAFLVFDRLLRSRIRESLPQRNFEPRDQIDVPLPVDEPNLNVALYRPGQESPELLDTGFIGRNRRGVIIDKPLERGLYRITATKSADDESQAAGTTLWETPVVVNGVSDESELSSVGAADFEQRVADANVRRVAAGEEISLAGHQIRGQTAWWWLALAVFGLLIFEMLVLGWKTTPAAANGTTSNAPTTQAA
ncbi:MAG: BatA domain-containing protein [Planctomycetales bacterium]|nr:BatA domain-containing protein [Planctomycetales bacterium]